MAALITSALLSNCGCNRSLESKAPIQPSPTSGRDRPPLRVALVDCGFEKELEILWQASSDQRLNVETLSREEARTRPQDATDVWIFPADMLGDLVESQRIGTLPVAVQTKAPETDESVKKNSLVDTWPARWRGSARYGSLVYAVPLGVKPLAVISNGLPLDGLNKADASNRPTEDLTSTAIAAWTSCLASLPPTDSEPVAEWTDQQRDWLVDRFLFIASTTNARYRGLFDLSKLTSKLESIDFVESARVLSMLYKSNPKSLQISPMEAWQSILDSPRASLAIGLPAPISALPFPNEASMITVGGLVWNPSNGLLAAVGKKTRQTSVSSQLVSWLSEPEQRAALAKLDSRIELWPTQPDPSSVRQDYRAYQTLCHRDERPEPTTLLIRFANAPLYRHKLGLALESILKNPDQAKEILADCAKQWDAITEQLDAPKQKRSVEQSLGFSHP